MANGTTITDAGAELLPARPGEERGTLTGWVQDLVYTVDHKKLGMLYIGTGLFFFVLAGIMALLIRAQLAFPNGRVVYSAGVQLLDYGARNRDDLLGRDADRLRDDQLSGAADDRSAGHGVSAAERFFVLVNFFQRIFVAF